MWKSLLDSINKRTDKNSSQTMTIYEMPTVPETLGQTFATFYCIWIFTKLRDVSFIPILQMGNWGSEKPLLSDQNLVPNVKAHHAPLYETTSTTEWGNEWMSEGTNEWRSSIPGGSAPTPPHSEPDLWMNSTSLLLLEMQHLRLRPRPTESKLAL